MAPAPDAHDELAQEHVGMCNGRTTRRGRDSTVLRAAPFSVPCTRGVLRTHRRVGAMLPPPRRDYV